MTNLVAFDLETGKSVAEGSIVTNFRDKELKFVCATRNNEHRYGGYRSGRIIVTNLDGTSEIEVCDDICNLEVRDMDLEE